MDGRPEADLPKTPKKHTMIQKLIARYKQMRTSSYLRQTYQSSYAFVGMGQHSLTNLYPVLHYLGVPLKYICITSERKARLIERKFVGVKATTSLEEILKDEAIKGVFVSASPNSHFHIASNVLQSGKSLFIEKPPCQTAAELDKLMILQRQYDSPVVMVGLQKRYAPAVQLLQKRLRVERLISYDLHYLTGVYPEGNALTELFIHPLDLVCHLFGRPEIIACRKIAPSSYLLMLQHPHIVGSLELATNYTWTAAEESLKVCTTSGIYRLSQIEELTYEPIPTTIFGVPLEKVNPWRKVIEHLYARNNLTPILSNNQIHSQGYFNEILSFVDAVEGKRTDIMTNITSMINTYHLLEELDVM